LGGVYVVGGNERWIFQREGRGGFWGLVQFVSKYREGRKGGLLVFVKINRFIYVLLMMFAIVIITSPILAATKKSPHNDLVNIQQVAPNIRQDIRYATANNFMHRKLYPVARCLLHEKVAQQLKSVQIELEKDNLGLKVFDCYRPLSIQKEMWKILPDNRYVANPAQGSRHNRASAIDLTLVDLTTGKALEMPSEFDDFSGRSHINYGGASSAAKSNRQVLRVTMEKHGFKGIPTEWWHYDSLDWKKYPVLDIAWK
jgi:zinc D-Ala-D-Ala dipeptidase